VLNDVLRGTADVDSTSWSPNTSRGLLAATLTRNASQVHTNPAPTTGGLFLNTSVAPFDRLDVRRAVNYAADRAAAVEVGGGPALKHATCQILPPNFPGYRPYCPFTAGPTENGSWTAPDLAKARALVAASGTRGMKVVVWSYAPQGRWGLYAVKLLRSLGYRTSLKVLDDPDYWSAVDDSRTRAQAGFTVWVNDYPAASSFFIPLFTCASFRPADPANTNVSEFCDPGIDRQIERALTLQATSPDAARGLWEQIDRQTVDQALWVPLVNPKVIDFLAVRVGNYQYSPQMGVLIDQLWVH
jgi:peptide/nickel transport system substrate-binding protein